MPSCTLGTPAKSTVTLSNSLRFATAAGDPDERLAAVLSGYARIVRQTRSHDSELVKFLHPEQQIAGAQRQLQN